MVVDVREVCGGAGEWYGGRDRERRGYVCRCAIVTRFIGQGVDFSTGICCAGMLVHRSAKLIRG